MKTIAKFIFGFPMLALASGSIAFAQNSVNETVVFKSGSQWKLTVIAVDREGLIIQNASFQKSPNDPFISVLRDGRQAEIFVPYHSGRPRFFDITQFDDSFKPLTLKPANFPAPLQILPGDKICKEVRNYLSWMDNFTEGIPADARVRYGQEVIYFSVLVASYYNYIMEWTFRDDGSILVRTGSTGPKNPGSPTEGHIHNFTWRLNFDLNGTANTAYLTSHSENPMAPLPPGCSPPGCGSTAVDSKEEIKTEGSRVWNPLEFNTLEIRAATLKNAMGHPTSYQLIPVRNGTARHSEPFTQADFWVTLNDPAESLPVKLPSYIFVRTPPGNSTIKKDLVVWYTGSAHHETNSRDEDFNTTPVIWAGFELEPQNLFDGTPFYPKR